ncbi:MAG: glycosyl transferase [Anaerolineae bacterium]|nr:glycosyl transferase [Anaerolineae bacterium]
MKRCWRWDDRVIAIMLALVAAAVLIATAPQIGVTWDEGGYISAAHSYVAWFQELVKHPAQAFQPDVIDRYWTVNHQHPPVEKVWSGLVWLAARNVFDELTANRLGDILMVAILVGLIYWMVAEAYGRAAGIFAAATLMLLPRFFFHAHLAALDVPVAVASFGLTFVFWKTVDCKGWAWGILWGLAWGLAEAIKLNGDFIPVALVVWLLLFRRSWKGVLRLTLMGLVGVATFFIVWPWLYYHPWERIVNYVAFHLNHYQIGQWYLGQFHLPPPWHFVFVMLWAVLPLSVIALIVLGIIKGINSKQDGGLVWLLILGAFVSISPFVFGQGLVYDNERLFMPVFPFLAALAGIGFGWLAKYLGKLLDYLKRPAYTAPAVILLGIALLMPQMTSIVKLYPHLLSYYSEDVGGLPGATKLGLETTYWCESYGSALPYINTLAKPGDTIWVEPWSFVVLKYYQEIGLLRPDLVVLRMQTGQFVDDADWYIFQFRQSQYGFGGEEGYRPYQVLKAQTPVYQVSYQGVPIMRLYSALR